MSKCEDCYDTGFYGNNGPGIIPNSEYQRCECGAEDLIHKRYDAYEQQLSREREQNASLSEENKRLKCTNEMLKNNLKSMEHECGELNSALDEALNSDELVSTRLKNKRLKSWAKAWKRSAKRWKSMFNYELEAKEKQREKLQRRLNHNCPYCPSHREEIGILTHQVADLEDELEAARREADKLRDGMCDTCQFMTKDEHGGMWCRNMECRVSMCTKWRRKEG